MDFNEVTLSAGVPYELPVTGHYLRLITGSGLFKIETDTGLKTDWMAGIGGRFSNPNNGEPFRRIFITSATAQVVRMLTSAYPIDDSRLTGDIDINGLLSVVSQGGLERARVIVNCAAGAATQILAADSDRLKALIHVDGANTIWLGEDDAVTNSGATKGLPVPSNSDVTDENTAPLWAYAAGGAASSVVILIDRK